MIQQGQVLKLKARSAEGLRPSELFGLKWRDIDRERGVVCCRQAGHPG